MVLKIVRVSDLSKYLKRRNVYLIDIRSRDEFLHYHIEGAIHVPEDRLKEFLRKKGKEALYILCCQHGVASVKAGKHLVDEGYSIGTVAGGVLAYQKAFGRR